jgi:hypothetical protein
MPLCGFGGRTTTMADTVSNTKQDLECLRLANECMELASDVLNPQLQSHLVLMARRWTALAEGNGDNLTTH